MNSQGHLLSEQTFQYDFLRQLLIFQFMAAFFLKKLTPVFLQLGRIVLLGKHFYIELLYNRQQIIAACYAKVLKFKYRCTDRTQEDLQEQIKVL